MRRLPLAAFSGLVLATIAAFFVTQHLKVTTPLLAGFPSPFPGAINPVSGRTCPEPGGRLVDHRRMKVSFYLLHRADEVAVYVVDPDGQIVRTLATGRHLGIKNRQQGTFYWAGHEDDGSVAPDGRYYIRVSLVHQGRTVEISNSAGPEPVAVITHPPHPVITSVSPRLIPQGSSPVTIRFSAPDRRSTKVMVYRTDLGGPRLVETFGVSRRGARALWDGRIAGRPAPQGVYMVGLEVTDAACNVGRFPARLPPAPGSTPHAGVTVRYLAAQPPLDPVAPGARALVYVDSRQRAYRWSLSLSGSHGDLARGSAHAVALRVRLPRAAAGLYTLRLLAGQNRTAVPIVAGSPARTRVLVVLPALTWQGLNPVDDDGDGLPNTLEDGGPIALSRPLVNGLPAGLDEEASLLAFLHRRHLRFDLTTDLALIEGAGPPLTGHSGVLLAGSERWVPSALATSLRAYVEAGGHLVSVGIDSLRRAVTLSAGHALSPRAPTATDLLGARHGPVVTHNHDLILVQRDGLGLFTAAGGALRGYGAYEPIVSVSAPARTLTEAGASPSAPAVVGYRLGRGAVVEVGLAGFARSLRGNVGAQELVSRLWSLLSGR